MKEKSLDLSYINMIHKLNVIEPCIYLIVIIDQITWFNERYKKRVYIKFIYFSINTSITAVYFVCVLRGIFVLLLFISFII